MKLTVLKVHSALECNGHARLGFSILGPAGCSLTGSVVRKCSVLTKKAHKIGFGDCDFIFLLGKHEVGLNEVHRDYRNPTIKGEKKFSDFLAGGF